MTEILKNEYISFHIARLDYCHMLCLGNCGLPLDDLVVYCNLVFWNVVVQMLVFF